MRGEGIRRRALQRRCEVRRERPRRSSGSRIASLGSPVRGTASTGKPRDEVGESGGRAPVGGVGRAGPQGAQAEVVGRSCTEHTARLCQNPAFGACGLCKPLILFDRIFEKSTFHTVSRCSRLPPASAPTSRPLSAAAERQRYASGTFSLFINHLFCEL